MKRRSAIIKDGNLFVYCRETIGGGYFYPVATSRELQPANEVETNMTSSIIVRFSDRRWVVSTKTADDNNMHAIRFECQNEWAAKEMAK